MVKTGHLPGHPEGEMISTYGIIFAFESSLKFETMVGRWEAKLGGPNPLYNSCSLIVILDKGIYGTVAQLPGSTGVSAIDFQGPSIMPIGTKIGLGYMECGEGTLDAFMRLFLPHLALFRHRIDHPGFKFTQLAAGPVSWVLEVPCPQPAKRIGELI